MYVSDYGFAANPSAWTTNLDSYNTTTSVNWLYLGSDEWTISPRNDIHGLDYYTFSIGQSGTVILINTRSYEEFTYYYLVLRPTFYLNSDVTYSSGTGTLTDPIRLGV